MNTKKALLVTGVTTAVGLASIGGVVSAATSPSTTESAADTKSSLIDRLAERFNLNKSDVEKVFEEERAEREKDRQQKMEQRLAQAVTDGKITEDQKAAILEKHQEMKAYMESIKDKPRAERKELMHTKMQELRQWAEDNNLEQYVHFLGKPGMAVGHHEAGPGDHIKAVALPADMH